MHLGYTRLTAGFSPLKLRADTRLPALLPELTDKSTGDLQGPPGGIYALFSAVRVSKVSGSAVIMWRNVSIQRVGLLRRLNRKVISSRYAARCFALTLCHVPTMPRLSRENALSTV